MRRVLPPEWTSAHPHKQFIISTHVCKQYNISDSRQTSYVYIPYAIRVYLIAYVLYTRLSSEMNCAQQQQLIKEHALWEQSRKVAALSRDLSLTLLLFLSSSVSLAFKLACYLIVQATFQSSLIVS